MLSRSYFTDDEAIGGASYHHIYLPPYRPDLNPFKNAFSKLKAILCMAAARAVDHLWAAADITSR